MITLYHCTGARSFRVLWTLEELGLPYDVRLLPSPARLSSGYLKLNPLGTVPLLVDGTTRMTESVAICEYLSQRYGGGRLSVAPDHIDYGRYLDLSSYGEATLTFPLTLVFRYRHLEPEPSRNPQVVADYGRWFLSRLRNGPDWEQVGQYLCDGRLTAADISVAFALGMAKGLALSDRMPSGAIRYLNNLEALPSYCRARALEGNVVASLG